MLVCKLDRVWTAFQIQDELRKSKVLKQSLMTNLNGKLNVIQIQHTGLVKEMNNITCQYWVPEFSKYSHIHCLMWMSQQHREPGKTEHLNVFYWWDWDITVWTHGPMASLKAKGTTNPMHILERSLNEASNKEGKINSEKTY